MHLDPNDCKCTHRFLNSSKSGNCFGSNFSFRDDQRNLGEISSSSAPSPQQVMLFLWIVEFCLHELAQIDAEMLQYSRRKYENNGGARGDPSKLGTGVPGKSLDEAGGPDDSGGGIRGTQSSTTVSESRVAGEYEGSEGAEGLIWLEKRKANAQAQLRKLLADFRNVNEVQVRRRSIRNITQKRTFYLRQVETSLFFSSCPLWLARCCCQKGKRLRPFRCA